MSSLFVMFRFLYFHNHLFLGSSVNISVYSSPKLPCDPEELYWVHGENVSGVGICLLMPHLPRFDNFLNICITSCESEKNQRRHDVAISDKFHYSS